MPFSGTVQWGASYLRETVVYVSGLLGRAEPVRWELWPDRWSCDSAEPFQGLAYSCRSYDAGRATVWRCVLHCVCGCYGRYDAVSINTHFL